MPTQHPLPRLVTASQIPWARHPSFSLALFQLGVGKLEVHRKLPETTRRGPAWEPSPHTGEQSPVTQEWLLVVQPEHVDPDIPGWEL